MSFFIGAQQVLPDPFRNNLLTKCKCPSKIMLNP